MKASSRNIPEKHDYVLGTVVRIASHGIYVELKEFEGVDAYCHISEIAGAWIRNIRNFVRTVTRTQAAPRLGT